MELIRVLTCDPVDIKTNRYGADAETWRVTFSDGCHGVVTERNNWIELRLDQEPFRTQTMYDDARLSPHVYAYQAL